MSTTTTCPSTETTACNYRSIWSLLASCGLTLLICVWNAVHPSVPLPHWKRIHRILYRLALMLVAFLTPEIMILAAVDEWHSAKLMTKDMQNDGCRWWTMAHSHFALIGGFVLRDDVVFKEIKVDHFRSLMREGKIVNPLITEDDINDKSTSDALGNAILVVQLSWFATQVVVRLVNHLTVTLVELDTVCMALLTLPLIVFCWEKPCCPGRPHIFYTRDFIDDPNNKKQLKLGYGLENLLRNSTVTTRRSWDKLLFPSQEYMGSFIALLLTWAIFGALHATAWNYEFPTDIEKTMWRVATLTLTGTPVIFGGILLKFGTLGWFELFLVIIGIISRVLLVALMFASLRSLPPSAHDIIPWTTYIPHL